MIKVSPKERRKQFFRVLLFLLIIFITWLRLGFGAKYRFPLDTIRMLFVASIQGEVSRKVSIGQAECDKRLNEVFQDSSKFHLKDKIDLEAQQELYSKLIEILASQDIEKKERLASFWANIQNRLNILSRQIEPQKKASYQVLYQNQT